MVKKLTYKEFIWKAMGMAVLAFNGDDMSKRAEWEKKLRAFEAEHPFYCKKVAYENAQHPIEWRG